MSERVQSQLLLKYNKEVEGVIDPVFPLYKYYLQKLFSSFQDSIISRKSAS